MNYSNYLNNPAGECKPRLGNTVDDVLKNWQSVTEKTCGGEAPCIVGFVQQCKYHWRQKTLMLARPYRTSVPALSTEIDTVRQAILWGNFFVVQYTGNEPLVLHQVGQTLVDKEEEKISLHRSRRLPFLYAVLRSSPSQVMSEYFKVLLRCIPSKRVGTHHAVVSSQLHTRSPRFLPILASMLIPALLFWNICFFLTDNTMLSSVIGIGIAPLSFIGLHLLEKRRGVRRRKDRPYQQVFLPSTMKDRLS